MNQPQITQKKQKEMSEKIKVGDPQPSDCKNCGDSFGYCYSDYFKIHYTTMHLPNGDHDGGQYSDSQTPINNGVTAHCSNCGERLSFKIDRQNTETLRSKEPDHGDRFNMIKSTK